MKTVIFSHPWNGSFNKAILDKVVEKLEETKEKYTIIDLNKDGFNPVMTEKDLELYSQGKSADPLVLKYQEILKNTDELILIFPIWWMSLPAILKGFFDKYLGLLETLLCNVIAEAASEYMERRVSEDIVPTFLRPAVGYPILPDHSLKKVVFDLIEIRGLF